MTESSLNAEHTGNSELAEHIEQSEQIEHVEEGEPPAESQQTPPVLPAAPASPTTPDLPGTAASAERSDAPRDGQASLPAEAASSTVSLSPTPPPHTDPLLTTVPEMPEMPEVLERKNWLYSLLLTLATMVGGLSSVCIKQLLLPIQVSILAPTNTNLSFTLVASVGAFAGLLASPVSGALSDRTTLRWGRRRPWIVFGLLATVIGMLLMAGATSIPILLLGEILAQVGVDTILATVTALLPDQVPPTQRSLLAAFVGLAPNVGGVVGLILVTRLTDPRLVWQGYVLMTAVSAVSVVLFLLVLRERPITREEAPPWHVGRFLLSFVAPLRAPNFVFVLLSRCCIYLAFTILGAYLLFALRGRLHLSIPAAAEGMTTFQLLSTACLLVIAILSGLLSHRLYRLKPFVFCGALLMGLALLLMATVPSWHVLLLSAALFGGGFGLYLGVGAPVAASASAR